MHWNDCLIDELIVEQRSKNEKKPYSMLLCHICVTCQPIRLQGCAGRPPDIKGSRSMQQIPHARCTM